MKIKEAPICHLSLEIKSNWRSIPVLDQNYLILTMEQHRAEEIGEEYEDYESLDSAEASELISYLIEAKREGQ